MAKRRAEDTPPAALWKDTFSDLMNLLLCFFVLLFSMSTVDSQKFEEIAASLSSSFSVLPSGGSALSKEGILVSSGASQLNDLSTYYNNMGLNTDADMSGIWNHQGQRYQRNQRFPHRNHAAAFRSCRGGTAGFMAYTEAGVDPVHNNNCSYDIFSNDSCRLGDPGGDPPFSKERRWRQCLSFSRHRCFSEFS